MDNTFISATDHAMSANSADSADHSARVADTSTAGIELRGLVVGYVQSGKTTSFTAVMAKAAAGEPVCA